MNKIAKIGEKQEEKKAEDTKICPHCYNKINIKADRCPYVSFNFPISNTHSEKFTPPKHPKIGEIILFVNDVTTL